MWGPSGSAAIGAHIRSGGSEVAVEGQLPKSDMSPISVLTRLRRAAIALFVLTSAAGCTTTSLVLGVAGVATDTSVTWEIAKHLHAQMTDGDPVSCLRMNSVDRALTARCGRFVAGSLRTEDIARNELQGCHLTLAARDPRLWPVLPELLNKGAQPETCPVPPLVALAAVQPCPDFQSASPAVRESLVWLAEADARSVRHDVVRMFSCPNARQAGLDRVLDTWLVAGLLQRDTAGFGVLGALHPDYLLSPFGRKLESQGHTAAASLGTIDGRQASGFEEALRTSNFEAVQWWLNRAPQLANRVPPSQGNRLPWTPLARVLLPGFLADPARQEDTVEFLLARGADPWKPIPGGVHSSVVGYAKDLKSPLVRLLDPPMVAKTEAPKRLLAQAGEAPPLANDVAANQGH